VLPEALRAQQFLLLTKTRNCHGWKVQSNPKPSGPLQQDYAEALYLAVRTAEPTVRPVYEVTKNRRQPWSHPHRDKTQLDGQLLCDGLDSVSTQRPVILNQSMQLDWNG
jgi:hypothetical protein